MKKEIKTGDKCPKCKNGRIALASIITNYAEKDPEPYTSGIEEGHQEEMQLEECINIGVHACDNCGWIAHKWFE